MRLKKEEFVFFSYSSMPLKTRAWLAQEEGRCSQAEVSPSVLLDLGDRLSESHPAIGRVFFRRFWHIQVAHAEKTNGATSQFFRRKKEILHALRVSAVRKMQKMKKL